MRITYWNADGTYHRRKAQILNDLPTHLHNGADKQAHSLSESPVYVQSEDPLYLDTRAQDLTWDYLTGDETWRESDLPINERPGVKPVPVPPPPPRGEGLAVLCETGAAWPVSCIPYVDPLLRQKEQADTHALAKGLAEARQARENSGAGAMQGAFLTLMGICALLTLIIGIVALDARFGSPDPPPAATAVYSSAKVAAW